MAVEAGVHEKGTISLSQIIRDVRDKRIFRKAGAIAMFVGVVRGETLNGEEVQKLELEAYEENASKALTTICRDLRNKEGIVDVQIHHLVGEFNVGEDLVYVLVAGAHREHVFPVLREAVDRYKKEATIFKKEHIITKKGENIAYWVTEHKNSGVS